MFCFCQNKRIPALCLILMGLGIILLIPKLASADSQPALYNIDIQANVEFSCGHCYLTAEEETSPSLALSQSTRPFDPCDICHTDIVETLPETLVRANELEAELFAASVQAIQLQQGNLSEQQHATIETVVDLLAQAQAQLNAGELEQAEILLEQAQNSLADIADEHHLANPFSPLFMPIGLVTSTTQKHNQDGATEHVLAGAFAVDNGQAWAVDGLETHLFNQISAEAMHRRAPPADEDAMMLANSIYLLT